MTLTLLWHRDLYKPFRDRFLFFLWQQYMQTVCLNPVTSTVKGTMVEAPVLLLPLCSLLPRGRAREAVSGAVLEKKINALEKWMLHPWVHFSTDTLPSPPSHNLSLYMILYLFISQASGSENRHAWVGAMWQWSSWNRNSSVYNKTFLKGWGGGIAGEKKEGIDGKRKWTAELFFWSTVFSVRVCLHEATPMAHTCVCARACASNCRYFCALHVRSRLISIWMCYIAGRWHGVILVYLFNPPWKWM